MSTTDYFLLSSTRCDPQLLQLSSNTAANGGSPSPFLLLSHHRDRLLDAVKLHGWPAPDGLALSSLEALCNNATQDVGSEAARIRILLSRAGVVSVTASPIAPLPTSDPMAPSLWLPSALAPEPPTFWPQILTVHPDSESTPSSVFTRTKTTCRDHYTAARNRFRIPPPPSPSNVEVVLYNEEGDITETSIRNIAFLRRSPPRWVTPSASTGCLAGVVRRWLLEQGRVVEADEGELRRSDILDGEYVLTFNGVEGCRIGRIQIASL